MKKFLLLLLLIAAPLFSAEVTEIELVPAQTGFWATSPRLALGSNGKILAIWLKHPGTHQGREIYGRLLSSRGTPAGGIFPVVVNQSVFSPSLVFNPVSNEYLLVYSFDRGDLHLEVYAQRLNLRGRKKGSPIRISAVSDLDLSLLNDFPKVLVLPDGRYFISWLRAGLNGVVVPGEGLYATVLNSNLSVDVAATLIENLLRAPQIVRGPNVRDVAFHEPSGNVILGLDFANPNSSATVTTQSYTTTTFNPDTAAFGPSRAVKATPSRIAGGSALLITGSQDAVIFFGDTRGIKRRAIGDNAAPAGTVGAAFKPPARTKQLFSPVPLLAEDNSTPTHSGVLFAIEDPGNSSGNGAIWAQGLNPDGKPVGVPEPVKTGFQAAVAISGLTLPSASGSPEYLVVYSNGQIFTHPSGGVTLLKIRFE